jgi:hypothetical protein
MEAAQYTIYNQTRETEIGNGVRLVNSTREPLTALRVMVEGLGTQEETGLWLTHVAILPMVPRISPFDLIYLDKENCVVECVELLPATEAPRFKSPAASVLVLPLHTIASARIERGDRLSLTEAEEEAAAPDQAVEPREISVPAAPPEPVIEEPLAALVEPRKQVEEIPSPFLAAFYRETSGPDAPGNPNAGAAPRDHGFALAQFLRTTPGPVDAQPKLEPQGPEEFQQAEQPHELLVFEAPEPAVPAPAAPEPLSFSAHSRAVSAVPEAAENAIRMQPPAPSLAAVTPEPASKENKSRAKRLLKWLYPSLYPDDRRSCLRRTSPGLVAYTLSDDGPRMFEVGNLSSRGLFLRTAEPWEPGTTLSLTLQPNGPFENDPRQRVEIDAGAVRLDSDGVGLSFQLPAGMELKLWEAPGRNGANENDPDCLVRELRMARALAFLRRICPPASEPMRDLIHKTLSNVRAANVVEIALKAERFLAQESNADCMVAHPDLTLRILEHGSWVDTEWLQELWAGLLATSCTFEGQDESNLVYINLLSKLAPLPTQILTMACAKATQAMLQSTASPNLQAISAEEMARITRSNNLTKIYRSIAELSDLGLLEKNARSASNANLGAAKAKPTHLGLQMYARCSGQRSVTTAA